MKEVDPWGIIEKLRLQHKAEIHEQWMPLVAEYREQVDTLQSRLEELNQKVEELEKDALRLDWMIDEQVSMLYERDNYWLVFPDGAEQNQSHKSGREAIDTAVQDNK